MLSQVVAHDVRDDIAEVHRMIAAGPVQREALGFDVATLVDWSCCGSAGVHGDQLGWR